MSPAAPSDEEARALAGRHRYGREPATELEQRLRAAFSVTSSAEPAE